MKNPPPTGLWPRVRGHSSTRKMNVTAFSVLLDACLLQRIVSFQAGLPSELLHLTAACDKGSDTLAEVVIKRRDLRLLQLVYRCYQAQPLLVKFGFHKAWQCALKHKFLAGLQWMYTLPVIQQQQLDEETMALALKLTGGAVTSWLVENRRVYKQYLLESNLRRVIKAGNLQLLKWLSDNIPDVPISAATMDSAAEFQQLEIIRYLHENRTEGCTTAAMDFAIIQANLPIMEFLQTNRSEGCSRIGLMAAKKMETRSLSRFPVRVSQEWLTFVSTNYAKDWQSLN